MDEKFEEFLASVDSKNQGFVKELNDYLTQNNCKCDIKSAKSGFVVSSMFSAIRKKHWQRLFSGKPELNCVSIRRILESMPIFLMFCPRR